MIQLGTGRIGIMNMETGEDLGVINEIPEVQTGGIVDEPFIGVNLGGTCECSISVTFSRKGLKRLKRELFKGTNNWRKRHHIPMMRKIYRR